MKPRFLFCFFRKNSCVQSFYNNPTSYTGYARWLPSYLGLDYTLQSLEHFDLDLRLGDILLAPAAIRNLVGLR